MSTVELKHKWVVDQNAWYIRFYMWLWWADKNQINFCKLFWAYIFTIPALLFRPLVLLFRLIDRKVQEWKRQEINNRIHASEEVKIIEISEPEPEPSGPSFMQRVLERIGFFFSKVIMRFGAIWFRLRKPVLFLAIVAGVLAGLGAIGLLIYTIATNWSEFLDIAWKTAKFVFGLVAGAGLIVLMNKKGVFQKLGIVLPKVGRKAKKGSLGFFGMLKQGFIAVKTNTCPEVIVEEKK